MPDTLVTIGADLAQLRRDVAKIAPEGGKAAAKILNDVSAAVTKAEKAAGQAKVSFDRMAKSTRAAGANTLDLKRGITMITAEVTAGVYAWMRFNQEVADSVNALNDMSTRTGVSAEILAGLQLAAEGSGQKLENLNSALQSFPKRLADFARGSGDARYALETLGYESTDANRMLGDMDGTLRDVVARIQAVPDAGQRAALATQIFGRSGANLLQALGTNELDLFVEQAERFGIDVGPAASKAADDWQRAVAELSMVTKGAAQDIATAWSGPGGPASVIRAVNAAVIFGGSAISGYLDMVMDGTSDVATLLEALYTRNFASMRGIAKEWTSGGRRGPQQIWYDAGVAAMEYLDQVDEVTGRGAAGGGEGGGGLRGAAAATKTLADEQSRLADSWRKTIQAAREADDPLLRQARLFEEIHRLEVGRLLTAEEVGAAMIQVYDETQAQLQAIRDREYETERARIAELQRLDEERRAAQMAGEQALLSQVISVTGQLGRQYQGVAYLHAVVSTAAGVARSLEDYPWPYSLGVGALVAAEGAIQIAAIRNADTSFSDTPGPVMVGDQAVRFAPTDTVIAARDKGDLMRQAEQAQPYYERARGSRRDPGLVEPTRHWDRWGRDALRAPGAWWESMRIAGRLPGRD